MTLMVIMVVIFVLTYDPKSRTLENVIEGSESNANDKPCCERNNYMANNQTQCESVHYQGVQFGNENYGCPTRHPRQAMGAIIGT
tara:strand:- start:3611 stop:3865 length:255 start_codon:yes stop_codon:yes gene_type:complete